MEKHCKPDHPALAECLSPRWQNACRRAGRMPVAALAECLSPRWQNACRRAGRMPVAALAECPLPRWQNACRRAGRMAVAARPAGHVALRIQGVHDSGDSYPTMRDG
ncbi:hypothetical protein EHI45_17355 [Rhizobium leguminosarum]|nr:hypothetical protein EHI45_17355 [Rhizobium leguminosarum]